MIEGTRLALRGDAGLADRRRATHHAADTRGIDHLGARAHLLGTPLPVLYDAREQVIPLLLPVELRIRFLERRQHLRLDPDRARGREALDDQRFESLDDNAATQLDGRC